MSMQICSIKKKYFVFLCKFDFAIKYLNCKQLNAELIIYIYFFLLCGILSVAAFEIKGTGLFCMLCVLQAL